MQLEARHIEHPYQVPMPSCWSACHLALNPRGQTYRAETLMTMTDRAGNVKALELFKVQAGCRRVDDLSREASVRGQVANVHPNNPPRKGQCSAQWKKEMFSHLNLRPVQSSIGGAQAAGWELAVENDIHYAYVQRRAAGYPAREEYFVVAMPVSRTRLATELKNSTGSGLQISFLWCSLPA